MITVAISTLGCKVNQYESAGILEKLDKSLFLPVPFHTKADCYIINTCTVTGRTDYQSRQIIRRAIRMNPDACIIVTGCYAQVAPGDIARIPGVTLIAGTAEKENIPQIIEHLVKGDPQLLVTDICQASEFSRLSPSQFPGRTRAFLKIQDGCNSFCSYCIVPYARGPSRSLAEREVFHKIKTLAGTGYREIVLTGIHLGVYGKDLVPPSNLLTIMDYVEKNKSVERLRLSSIEITEITDDMIGLMKKSATLCRHLHIPLQSGDDGILSAMKRNYDSAFFKKRLEEIHRELPRIAIGIDVMVGFPGESEDAFHNTVALLEELPLAYAHVFPYSERPGTQAKELSGKVSDAVKKRRNEIVRNLGSIKRKTFAEK
ncbi:MAG: tRNA (N(6)-L-threonylcarbamoyladenosine(37)-C(2))-methylthiotransferase MtaB, partial [Deltaproteobacteria bacterium]|nr:tRNA (N(6)-L-threonylcarbamoyladenosine(37)-C(2))-methylthiotransferase MtaB [Deltaproteobacteria bacterium]